MQAVNEEDLLDVPNKESIFRIRFSNWKIDEDSVNNSKSLEPKSKLFTNLFQNGTHPFLNTILFVAPNIQKDEIS